MRILHICSRYEEGMVSQLHESMLRDGDDSVVYYGFGELSNVPKTFRFNSETGMKLYDFLARVTGKQGCFASYPTFLLKHRIREFRPEIIHIHGLCGNYFHYYRLLHFLKERKYKVILTIDNPFLLTGADHLSECYQNGEEPAKPGKVFGNRELFDGFDRLIIAVPDQCLLEQFQNSYLKKRTFRFITTAEQYRTLYREIRQKTAEQYFKKMYAGE